MKSDRRKSRAPFDVVPTVLFASAFSLGAAAKMMDPRNTLELLAGIGFALGAVVLWVNVVLSRKKQRTGTGTEPEEEKTT